MFYIKLPQDITNNIFSLYVKLNVFKDNVLVRLVSWAVRSAGFASEVGQCFGVDRLIEESEAGGGDVSVA